MKKEYIKPAMQVYEMKTQQILAGSPGLEFSNESIPTDKNEEMWWHVSRHVKNRKTAIVHNHNREWWLFLCVLKEHIIRCGIEL